MIRDYPIRIVCIIHKIRLYGAGKINGFFIKAHGEREAVLSTRRVGRRNGKWIIAAKRTTSVAEANPVTRVRKIYCRLTISDTRKNRLDSYGLIKKKNNRIEYSCCTVARKCKGLLQIYICKLLHQDVPGSPAGP